MTSRIDAVVSAVLVIAVSTISATYVYGTFFASQRRAAVPGAAVKIARWPDALHIGHTISGDSTASTTMVMFGDLQCPACKGYNTTLQKVIADHPHDLRVVYVSFPLPYHAFALPAARATECISQRGNLGKWIDLIYTKQDSLGLKSWDSFAHDAGVRDTSGIDACASDPKPIANIESGLELGKAINLRGTPTLVINGWLYPSSPSAAQIDSAVAQNNRSGSARSSAS